MKLTFNTISGVVNRYKNSDFDYLSYQEQVLLDIQDIFRCFRPYLSLVVDVPILSIHCYMILLKVVKYLTYQVVGIGS